MSKWRIVLDIMSTNEEEGERIKEGKNSTAAPWHQSHLNQILLSPFSLLLVLETQFLTIA